MATTRIETVNTGADKAKIFGALALALAGFVAYFMLAAHGSLTQWGALLAGVVAGAGLFMLSGAGRLLAGFMRDSVKEMEKVVPPTRKDAMQTTMFVFVFAVTMSLFLWLTDKLLEWVLYGLILGWK